jgi:deoxyribodipyrimidine photo-lyase
MRRPDRLVGEHLAPDRVAACQAGQGTLPELAHLPAPAIHTPWLAGARAEYPAPIVDHEAAARVARDRLWGARHGQAYRAAAAAIQAKHGSRKSGLKPTLRRPTRRAAPAQQLLDL